MEVPEEPVRVRGAAYVRELPETECSRKVDGGKRASKEGKGRKGD
jgi:hypothetical protein